jgi:hypothetical protein
MAGSEGKEPRVSLCGTSFDRDKRYMPEPAAPARYATKWFAVEVEGNQRKREWVGMESRPGKAMKGKNKDDKQAQQTQSSPDRVIPTARDSQTYIRARAAPPYLGARPHNPREGRGAKGERHQIALKPIPCPVRDCRHKGRQRGASARAPCAR